jgi:hypothetical protein
VRGAPDDLGGAVLRRGRIVLGPSRAAQMIAAERRFRARLPTTFSIKGAVYFFAGNRSYLREGDIPSVGSIAIGESDITDAPTGDFRQLLREGLEESAVDAFLEAAMIAYGIEGSTLDSVDSMDIR